MKASLVALVLMLVACAADEPPCVRHTTICNPTVVGKITIINCRPLCLERKDGGP